MWAAIRSMRRSGRIKSPYEMVEAEERIRMIGGALESGGRRWSDTHRNQMDWLSEQGISPFEAMRRYREWIREQKADPFWER